MKKIIVIFVLFISLSVSTVLSAQDSTQEDDQASIQRSINFQSSFLNLLTSNEPGVISNDQYIKDILNGSTGLDVADILVPELLAWFSGYSTRKSHEGKRDLYFNGVLESLLQIIQDNASTLQNTEKYVEQLQIVIENSENPYLVASAISTYGTILDVNYPIATDSTTNESADEAFLVTSLAAIRRLSFFRESDEATHILRVSAPFVRSAIQRDNSIIKNVYVQGELSYLTTYYTSQAAVTAMTSIINDIFIIELNNLRN